MVAPQLDDADRDIIDQLRIDGRKSFSDIGREIGLSEPTVRQRYHRLVQLGVLHVVGMYEPTKIGGVSAHIGLRVVDVPVTRAAEQLAQLPEVKYVACALGYYDVILDVWTSDVARLGQIVLHDIRRIHGVSDVETLMVLDVLKDTYLWKGFRDFPR